MKNKIFTLTTAILGGMLVGAIIMGFRVGERNTIINEKQNMIIQLEENLNAKNIELENIQQQAAPYLNLIELNNQISDLDGKKDRLVEVKTELQNNLHILIGE